MKYPKSLSLAVLSLLLLTGCSIAQPEPEKPAATAATETTAATAATETTEITETAAPSAENTEDWHIEPEEVVLTFTDYDEFAEQLQSIQPGAFLYQLPEDSGFRIEEISLHDDAFYHVYLTNDNGSQAMLEVMVLSTYDSIEELQKIFGGSVNVEGNTFDIAGKRILFEHYSEGLVTLMGLAGERNTTYLLLNTSPDRPTDTAGQEQALLDLCTALGLDQ